MNNIKTTISRAVMLAFALILSACSNTSSPKIPIQGYYQGYDDTSTTSGTGGGTTTQPTSTTQPETKNYIGSHKPTETKKVGDIIFSDGSFERLNEILYLSSTQQSNAVAVIFYVGTSSDSLGQKTLGVSLFEAQKYWIPNENAEGFKDVAVNESDGTVNTNAIKAKSDYNETNYPAFYWADTYSAKGFSSGWYLPAQKELKELYDQKTKVNSAIKNIEVAANYSPYATKLGDKKYWTSTRFTVYYACYRNFADGSEDAADKAKSNLYVRAIRAF